MRIAIIGSGIAGHGAAYRLTRQFGARAVTLFEKSARPGGHAATVDIAYDGARMTVDTGFIVYNRLNYPLLDALFTELGVPTQPSEMSFSLSLDGGAFEWSGQDRNRLRSLFAQPENLVSPRFWRMLGDILRFNRAARKALDTGRIGTETLAGFLARERLGADFRDNYILPMGAAIWSMPARDVLDFPAERFLRFFDNHRLLHASRPAWRTVTGGSRAYVDRLQAASGHELRCNTAIVAVRRRPEGVELATEHGERTLFDAVLLATHADQALALLDAPRPEERAVLGAIRHAANDVYLHRDVRLMPRRRAAWAAWNVLRGPGSDARPVAITYWMNRLQGLDPARPVFVSLNPPEPPAAECVFGRYSYAHPQFDAAAIAAQAALPRLQGNGGVYFAGAWAGYGFHEDGLRSGYAAAERLIADHVPATARMPAAAE
ncbi:NAD(P)/FAD-dependent oxidoreductase [Rhabdaerophilum calidifontis]|uniref:NAD(P)/FAD-dependent oxidoreductase n=1 Tax=Rhabdaerophilum calidifontis TaxID=2604328 RepID=UPI001239DBD2|nr:FAD-dependent oxidoreductase [Rhabdaerophilum calidifontis]